MVLKDAPIAVAIQNSSRVDKNWNVRRANQERVPRCAPGWLTRRYTDRRLPRMRLLTNGTILTMSAAPARADAVAIDGDRIVAVGSVDAVRAAAPHAEELDLQGGCVLPGFIDAHHHFSEGALLTSRLNLHWPAVETVADILERVRQEARTLAAGEWIIGEGYDERRIRESRPPTRAELDAVAPNHPVLLVQFSYHELVVNTCAHRVLGVGLNRRDPSGGEIERGADGQPTGRMIENAGAPFYMGAVQALIERDRAGYFACLERYQRRLFAAGLTRVFDPAVSPLMESTLGAAAAQGVLRIPVLMMPSSADGMFMPPRDRLDGARSGAGTDPLRTGPLKMFMDGGVRCAIRMGFGTALSAGVATLRRALRRGSLDPLRSARQMPMRIDLAGRCIRSGILFYSETEARDLVSAAVEHGMSIAVHAEGNVAIDRSLRVLPRSRADRAPGVGPNRIEHFFLPDPDAIQRAADLQLAIATQPTISEWIGEQLLDTGIIGRRLFMPLRALFDAGLTVAGSSDAPVVSFDPLRGIRCAVERKTINGEGLGDGQEISVREALEMYTIHAARSGGLEHEVGSIRPGKRADLVVLSHDPTQLRPSQLDQLTVRRTIGGGVDVFVADRDPG